MQIEVISLIENEDGSAEVSFDMDEEAKEFLIQYALKSLLIETAKDTLARKMKEFTDG